MRVRSLLPTSFLAAVLAGQSNVTPGLDVHLGAVAEATVFGRAGPPFPAGAIGFSVGCSMCNVGSAPLPSFGAMQEAHPVVAFLLARLANGRIEQISDRSFCKHVAVAFNNPDPGCGSCTGPAVANQLRPGCSDTYGAGSDGDRFWLGPAGEIDPWLGGWHHVGSYFDRGDPDVGAPADQDGQRSLLDTSGFDEVKNRVVVRESDLLTPGASFCCQVQLVVAGEAVQLRGDDAMTRGVAFAWDGAQWTATETAPAQTGCALLSWPGATVAYGGNGQDDGRFAVGALVTGPFAGRWHYEYAVQNLDNGRGAAAFRVPVCPSARITGLGFRDLDADPLDEWAAGAAAGEIAWLAPAGNALEWNTIFNFAFDSDTAPVAGTVLLDEARPGPGLLQVAVAAPVPGFVPAQDLGPGCGAPIVTLRVDGVPTIPSPDFGMRIETSPNTVVALFYSWAPGNLPIDVGCTAYLDLLQIGLALILVTDASGAQRIPASIPPGLLPAPLYMQALSQAVGGAVLHAFNLSNGIQLRLGATGCQ
jgi:hypothetical protein